MSTLNDHYHDQHIVCTICEASPQVIESGSPIAFRDTREYVDHMQSFHNQYNYNSNNSSSGNQKITFRIGNTYHSQFNQNAKMNSTSSNNSNGSRALPYVDLHMGSANPYSSNNNSGNMNHNRSSSNIGNNNNSNKYNNSSGYSSNGMNILDSSSNSNSRKEYTSSSSSSSLLQHQIIPSHMKIAGKVTGIIMNTFNYIYPFIRLYVFFSHL